MVRKFKRELYEDNIVATFLYADSMVFGSYIFEPKQ